MKIYDNTIFFFEKEISTKNLKELDSYDVNYVRTGWDAKNWINLENVTIDNLNQNLEKAEEEIFEYLLEFKNKSRPDLKTYHWMYYLNIDRNKIDWNNPPKKSESFSSLRKSNQIKMEKGWMTLLHRGNVFYEGNYSRVTNCLNRFTILIGLSQDDEHESEIYFPIQKQGIKLNRGDVLIVPGGITHPFVVNNIINGKFKFIEGL